MSKVPFPIHKRAWHPSLLPGIIVLISTCDADGSANIAPKSWVQMVSFDPPILMFSGTRQNTTEQNILATGCFGLNIVNEELADVVYGSLRWRGEERIARCGLTLVEGSRIRAPIIRECPANLECELRDTREIGSGFVIFGEIVAASICASILDARCADQYAMLRQALFLEDGVYAVVDNAHTAHLPS